MQSKQSTEKFFYIAITMAPFVSTAALAHFHLLASSHPSSSSSSSLSSSSTTATARVVALQRYAVKGLAGDALSHVALQTGETFPDDRRFALLYNKNAMKWNQNYPQDKPLPWLHKENFLCAFTRPDLLAKIESSYEIITNNDRDDDENDNETATVQRLIKLNDRQTGQSLIDSPLNLELEEDRQKLADLFSSLSQQDVRCITAVNTSNNNKSANGALSSKHTHQFGNTSSGYKQRNGDTRTIHIINQATVREFSRAIGIPIDPLRFRPNVVIDGPPAWNEFDWIHDAQGIVEPKSGLKLTVISKTVRCQGISVDPLDPDRVLDVPALLMEHFPQYGPFLGVYAVVDEPGRLAIGDELQFPN